MIIEISKQSYYYHFSPKFLSSKIFKKIILLIIDFYISTSTAQKITQNVIFYSNP